MGGPAEDHDRAWATRGGTEVHVEEAPRVPQEGLRRFRPGKQDELPPELVERYEAARAAALQQEEGANVVLARVTEEILSYTSYEDTEALVRGEDVVVTAEPDLPWSIGERLEIVDERWRPACVAEVVEHPTPSLYRLRGVGRGRLDD